MSEMSNREAIDAWAAGGSHVGDFGDEGDFTRRYLLNPAIFALLGSVAGHKILDVGCGQGYLCRLLAKHGAIVTGVEPAEPWYKDAVERECRDALGITYLQADLSTLTHLPTAFDAVVANMVLMDIPDYAGALRNCIGLLRTGGSLIFSLLHPCFEEPGAEWAPKGYVAVREYLQEHVRQQSFAPLFHRPLSRYLNLVIQEGGSLRQILEPGLGPEWANHGPAYERNVYVPSVIVVHAVKV
jgi:2-polyprenyl-3-methyl-5-hydroxy-6-metoxy-1,4-benzoquinol methylase